MIGGLTTTRGGPMPRFGLGTWRMGERLGERPAEIAALQLGLDLGVGMIDTAEMYGDGGAEEIVGAAIRGRREPVYVVTKVLPGNASCRGTVQAAERSLRRLGIERIDLYLLHWPGSHPLDGTLEAFQQLQDQGKVASFGVSNFDAAQMRRVEGLPGGTAVAANQVLYNLCRRGIERRLIPWCREHQVAIMAYSPLEGGALRRSAALDDVAADHGVSSEQVAIAWTLREPGLVTLPKAVRADHVRDCIAAAGLQLSAADLARLEAAYPAPDRDGPLETA